jgi:serine/threonine-protein kinase RsbW
MPRPELALLERRVHRTGITALRADVRRAAMACGLTEQRLGDFLVAVNEIVANAVLHGGGSGQLYLWRDGDALLCEVTDEGPGFDQHRIGAPLPGPQAASGRGLWLARRLVDALTISNRSNGTTVRLRMTCAPADPVRRRFS